MDHEAKVLDTVKKHPLLMFVYGGPENNTVNNAGLDVIFVSFS